MNRIGPLKRGTPRHAALMARRLSSARGQSGRLAATDIADRIQVRIHRHRRDRRRAVLALACFPRSSPTSCRTVPARYARLGFTYETPTSDLPIGTTKSTDWIPRVGLNCATCHAGAYRDAPGAPPKIVLGMPAHQMDLQGYARFLSACAKDPRFNADTLVAAMQKHPEFGFVDGLGTSCSSSAARRTASSNGTRRIAWFDKRPPQGPGRVDTFNPYKAMFAEGDALRHRRHGGHRRSAVALEPADAARGCGCTGTATTTPWTSATRARRSAPGRRRTRSISPRSIASRTWILDLKPPAFPAGRIDAALAAAGRPIYQQNCASCHDIGQPRVGQVDRHRRGRHRPRARCDRSRRNWSTQMNTIGTGKPWRFSHFRKTNGYAGMPLDGIWLRAPYLHNGSVPTLRALLLLDERPARFYRAYNVYDWRAVGFVSSGPEAEKEGVAFDTSLRGNGNGGHTYGRDLSVQDREALIEYLKTL